MKPQTPHTYDEITRRTVVGPDGVFRTGSDSQAHQPDHEIYALVSDVLLAVGHNEVGLEVADGRVLLRGRVRDQLTIDRILRLVHAATDAEVENRMFI